MLFRSGAGLLRPTEAIPFAVPSRSEHARFTMRFLVTGAAGAVRKDFLDASLVCLGSAALTLDAQAQAQSPICSHPNTLLRISFNRARAASKFARESALLFVSILPPLWLVESRA